MFNSLARPFGMLMMFLYEQVSNYGIAIILFALVIKIILLPFQMKSKRGMMQQARLQPQIAELQKKHGTNKAKINEETMKLYKEEGVNPASGCLWGFIPLPIMLALFQVIRQPITTMMGVIAEDYEKITELLQTLGFDRGSTGVAYEQIAQSQFITNNFSLFRDLSDKLRVIDFNVFKNLNLGATPQWQFLWNPQIEPGSTWIAGFILFLIPLISGGMQFLSTHINRKMNPPAVAEGQAKQMNTMLMFMPLISVYIAFITPAALGFYWTISTVLQVVQDMWLTKVFSKKIEAEEALKNEEREKKEAEIEAKRIETERKRAEGLVERNPNTAKRKKQKSEKQEQIEKAAEWQKKQAAAAGTEAKHEPGRIGERRYARGRAYDPDRYAVTAAIDAGATPEDETENASEDMPDDTEDSGVQIVADADSEYDNNDGDDEYEDETDEDETDEDETDEDETDEDETDEDETDDGDYEYEDDYDDDETDDEGEYDDEDNENDADDAGSADK